MSDVFPVLSQILVPALFMSKSKSQMRLDSFKLIKTYKSPNVIYLLAFSNVLQLDTSLQFLLMTVKPLYSSIHLETVVNFSGQLKILSQRR